MDNSRNGLPTSSQIYKLMTNGTKGNIGKPALTYIEEKKFERELGRSISTEQNARPTSWGHALESYVYNEYLPLEYKLQSNETIIHSTGMFAGTPDIISDKRVGDIKCPWTLLSFMKLKRSIETGIEELKESHPEYYYQLVSNAILTGKNEAELVVFCPKKSQLEDIRHYVDNLDTDNPFVYKFIVDCSDEELPYIPDECEIKSIQRIVFEVTEEEKDALWDRVVLANQLINQ